MSHGPSAQHPPSRPRRLAERSAGVPARAVGIALLLVLAGCSAEKVPSVTPSSAPADPASSDAPSDPASSDAPADPEPSDATAEDADPETRRLVSRLNAAAVCERYEPIAVSEPVDSPPKASAQCYVGDDPVVVSVFGSPRELSRYLKDSDESLRGVAVFDVAVGDKWLVNCGQLRDRCQQAVKVLGGAARRVGSES